MWHLVLLWMTSIEQVGTHADSLIAEAVIKGVKGFDVDLAWEAAYKDAVIPPENDWNTSYASILFLAQTGIAYGWQIFRPRGGEFGSICSALEY